MPTDKMMAPPRVYDAITIATFAMFSLLSGAEPCTMPTEQEEVKKRYDDMLGILGKSGKFDLVEAFQSYFPCYEPDKWPWAMSRNDYDTFLREQIRTKDVVESPLEELCISTMTELLANEEIEAKYRLSRVRPKLLTSQLLPF